MPPNVVLRRRARAVAQFLNSHRIFLYCCVSLLAVAAVIANALKNYSNFYSVAIYLAKSSRSVLVLANFGFLVALLCGHIVQKIFFGTLRPNEVERLYDRLWFFITESLLAFTIFRDEFDTPFALMFGFLLFVKSFHWLTGDRIEWMDQRPYPGPSLVFHLRMMVLLCILFSTDFVMFVFAVDSTITNGVGGMVLFASEYGILMASIMNSMFKYLLSAYEFRRAGQRGGENAPPWENKSMWIFYIELATDFLKLTTYLVFFTIIITFYGLPLNIIRDVYITAKSFITRLRALHRYQAATRNMDQRYPNATEEELTAMSDRTCIICREEMVLQELAQAPATSDGPNTTPKKLPCGHIFHFHCLRSWLERQQSCPTCRRTVLDNDPPGQRPPIGGAIPVPGQVGAPQLPALGFQGMQNQNQPPRNNNPLGNPLGFVGRLFGPPAQPGNPGPFVLPHPPQNANHAGQIPGNIAGQIPPGGIYIQYQVQYQFPRHPQREDQQGDGNRNTPLRPLPRFPGFPGPDGAWREWPPALQDRDPNAPNAGIPNSSSTTGTPIVNQDTNPASTQNPNPASVRTPTSTPPSREQDSPNTSLSPGIPPTPREAAALAALRRFNVNGTNQASSSTRDAIPSSSRTLSSDKNNANANTSSEKLRGDDLAQEESVHPPHLIPLYDYTEVTRHTPLPTDPIVTYAPNNGEHGSPLHSSNNHTHSRASNFERYIPAERDLAALASLPPSLDEEQLRVMDTLTREAIDERLRVLEGVSNAVYRCVDELMRMRSTLPLSASTPMPSHSGPSSLPSENEGSSSATEETASESFIDVEGPSDIQVGSSTDIV